MRVDLGKENKLKFLLDTGADLSVVKRSRLNPEINYSLKGEINIKGISNTVMKTEETVALKLYTDTRETTHTFHVVGSEFGIHYDGILGRNFFEDKQSIINYCDQQIVMGNVVVKLDSKSFTANIGNCKLSLKARSENIVKLPNKSVGHGLTSKKELMPGVYLAESLTKAMDGMCITSIVNTLEEDITLDLPQVLLEEIDDNEESMPLIYTAVSVQYTGRISRLRYQLRTDHLNDEERVSLVKLCDEYNDIFHLPDDKLTYTTAAEHPYRHPQ